MSGSFAEASRLRPGPHLHEELYGAVRWSSCSVDVSVGPQEAQLESDRAEVGSPEQGKGVAGSGRPRYCRKCHVRSAHSQCLHAPPLNGTPCNTCMCWRSDHVPQISVVLTMKTEGWSDRRV